MRFVALFLLAVIAAAPARAAQSAVAPQSPLSGPTPPLNKETLELMLRALTAQQQLEIGSPSAGAWQMLEAKSISAPAVWLLNSSTGELSFCSVPATGAAGIMCYTKK